MDQLPEAAAIRKMHSQDTSRSAENLFDFLSGWLDGPPIYVIKKGHPCLRMRHINLLIGQNEYEQWMLCMKRAIVEQIHDEIFLEEIVDLFNQMAHHMINK